MKHARRVLIGFVAGLLWMAGWLGNVQADDLARQCRLEPVNGSCKARITKAKFDQKRKKCVAYSYDGCGSVVPFDDLEKCQVLCETAEDIRLAEIRRIKDRPYAVVEVEYPKSWPDGLSFAVSVNDQPADTRILGGGYSTKAKNVSLEVYMGEKPVRDVRVTASHNARLYEAGIDLQWSFPAMVLLLDHPGTADALFDATTLRFFLFKADDLTIHHNGEVLATKPVDGIVRHGHVRQVTPAWRDGLNTITLIATAANGSRLERNYTFVFLGGGRLTQGETATVIFGSPGSRSGPFYRVDVAGDSVTMEPETLFEVNGAKFDTPDSQGWLVDTQVLTRKIVGSALGEATVLFYETPHFREPERLVREFRLRVVERDLSEGPTKGKEPR